MKINDKDLMEMTLQQISDLLSCQYDNNVPVGVPEAMLVLEGTSPTTKKRMQLIVTLKEKGMED